MKYPSFSKVGEYVSKTDFKKQRTESVQWVHYDENVNKIINGNYDEIKPLHVEFCLTNVCNFGCSWCSYSSTKKNNLKIEKNNNNCKELTWSQLKEIIDQLSINNIGIQWTGGEPTIAKQFIKAIEYSSSLNLSQCLFTNGSYLNRETINRLMLTNLVFIRVSLNTISPEVHSQFHGLKNNILSVRVEDNLQTMFSLKLKLKSKVDIGISILINEINIRDLESTLTFIYDCARVYKNSISYVILRPVFNFNVGNQKASRHPNISDDYNGIVHKLQSIGIKLIRTENFEFPPYAINNELGCLSANWFSEIMSNGNLMMCSDVYGNENYIIGNLMGDSINQIYKSQQKDIVHKLTISNKCFPNECPKNGRGFMLNSIFHQIEKMRIEGRIDIVAEWISDIRKIVPKPEHSFYI